MIIKPKNYNANQLSIRIIEHFISSILSFLLTFLLLFFYGLKNSVKYNNKIIDYLLTHFSLYLLICVLISLIVNIIIVTKNLEKISIREFEFSGVDSLVRINYKKGYRNINYTNTIPFDSMCINKRSEENFLGDKTKIIEISTLGDNVFRLDVSDFIWSSDKIAIRDLFAEINLVINKKQPITRWQVTAYGSL